MYHQIFLCSFVISLEHINGRTCTSLFVERLTYGCLPLERLKIGYSLSACRRYVGVEIIA